MPNQGTESQFEATTIDRLRALGGYRYQYGGEIERDLREVVMTDWLRAFLKTKYPHLADGRDRRSDRAIVAAGGCHTEQRNKNFHQLFTRGFEQRYRKPDGAEAIRAHLHRRLGKSRSE